MCALLTLDMAAAVEREPIYDILARMHRKGTCDCAPSYQCVIARLPGHVAFDDQGNLYQVVDEDEDQASLGETHAAPPPVDG